MTTRPQHTISGPLKLGAIYVVCLVYFGCIEPRRDFCDCMDIGRGLADGLTLSKKEMEAKQRNCKWIEEELSPLEIIQRTAKCYSKTPINVGEDTTQQQTKQEVVPPATNDTSGTRTDHGINTIEQTIIQPGPSEIESTHPGTDLQFMFDFIRKQTKDVDLLNNTALRRRLKDLLGQRFSDIQSIYDSSENSLIWIPYRNKPTEIAINIVDKNDPNNNAEIVVDPKRDFINVRIMINGRNNKFYEDGKISKTFQEEKTN